MMCTLECKSCQYPGSLSSRVATPPPGQALRSSTSTFFPALARYAAATRPLCPAPITTISFVVATGSATPRCSGASLAAVGQDGLPGDERRIIRGEKRHDAGLIVGRTAAFDRLQSGHLVEEAFRQGRGRLDGARQSGCDAVDRDAALADFAGQAVCETHERPFARDV